MIKVDNNMILEKEEVISVYEKDCEFNKYHDELKWNRFQTAAVVEGGILFAIYNLQIGNIEKSIILIIGTLLIFMIYLLFLRNEIIAYEHLDRIKEYEEKKGIKYPKKEKKWPPEGKYVGKIIWYILFSFNIILLINIIK